MRTDEELVETTLNGSAAAFAELVERYQERLLRFLLTRCATRADAEDALQETFLNAYRYLPSYRTRWRFSTWLYRIAIRNAWRQRDAGHAPYEDHPDYAADPLEACIANSDRENAWSAARRLLTPDARTALWLRYVEDMSIREVARALGRSQAWTKVTLMRSRRRLQSALAIDAARTSERKAYG
ncbi:MAG TPA: sigma-70 family RNA polymerase sigma factor [Woeseiaceae bacterium]|nr:sigma-70 family RNA polymerase sigma factor [Woeseiaceae bacterium]